MNVQSKPQRDPAKNMKKLARRASHSFLLTSVSFAPLPICSQPVIAFFWLRQKHEKAMFLSTGILIHARCSPTLKQVLASTLNIPKPCTSNHPRQPPFTRKGVRLSCLAPLVAALELMIHKLLLPQQLSHGQTLHNVPLCLRPLHHSSCPISWACCLSWVSPSSFFFTILA